MTAIRYVSRTGLGLVLMASMFAVPMMAARAGGSYTMTVDHQAPDGPDPVTVNFDASFNVKVTNNTGSPQVIEIAPNTVGVNVLLLNTKSSPVDDHVDVVDKTGDDASGFLPADGGKLKTDGKPNADDNTNSVIRTFNGSGPGGVFDLHDLQPGDPDFEEICGSHDC